MAEEQKPTFFNNVIKSGASSIVDAGKDIWSGIKSTGSNLASAARMLKNGIPKGAQPDTKGVTTATMAGTTADWRVRLSLPAIMKDSLKANEKSAFFPTLPLVATDGLIFPYTPQITISHTANYNTMAPVHSNYPFLSYENSRVDEMSIVGDFYCEDSADAAYWLAAVHYLRTVTKMDYGANSTGGPPPVVKLYGYGDYVFNGVPVVVKNFLIDMPKDVDYIPSTYIVKGGGAILEETGSAGDAAGINYAPVKSTITVNVMPVYSRTQVRNFNLKDFVDGKYINGTGTRFI